MVLSSPVTVPAATGLSLASAGELLAMLRTREVSAVELLEAVLQRADDVTGAVNPFALRLDERAFAAAGESDRRLAAGTARPLEGLPLTAKDSQWLAEVPTTSGSPAPPVVPARTVGGLQRILDAGAVLFGRTTTSEFCYGAVSTATTFGATANPHDLSRTAGGSSGGAAAQVAAHAGPVALGGDGGGSIRIPAAFCGVVGFKPTLGAVSHEPSGPGWKTLIGMGPLTRTVADAALVLDAMAGFDPADRHSVSLLPEARGPLRVAVSEDLGFAPVDDDVRLAFRAAVDALTQSGVEIVPADPGLESSAETWATIATAEARWSNHLPPELLSPVVRAYLAFGETITADAYVGAQFRREEIHAAYADLFARTGASALFTPTVGCVAFDAALPYPEQIGGVLVTEPWRDWAPFLYDANLVGLPACTVPIGTGALGLPVGGQLLGPRLTDRTVLHVAELLQNALTAPTHA